MKKTVLAILLLSMLFCFFGCEAFTSQGEQASDSKFDTSRDESDDGTSHDSSVLSEEELISAESSEDTTSEVSIEEGVVIYSGDYGYILENDVARICSYNGSEEKVVLPDEIDGHTVSAVDEKAFYGNAAVKEIYVGDTVANIASLAFGKCTVLEMVHIGNSVAVMETDCFDGSGNLKKIEVSPANSAFSAVDGVLYNEDKTVLLRCPEAYVADEFEIAENVLSVGVGAFKNCSEIAALTIPDGCTLSSSSFYLCSNLASVEFGSGVETIPDRCFFGCPLLEEINIPDGVTTIGEYAFFGCVGARKLVLPNSLSDIAENAFECCGGFENVSAKGEYAKAWYEKNKDGLKAS